MDKQGTKILVDLQMEKANRFLRQAEEMYAMQYWDLAANRYYYACYRDYYRVRQVPDHVKDACIPGAWCFANLSGYSSNLCINIVEHAFKVSQNPALQHFLDQFGNLLNDSIHLSRISSYEKRVVS